MNTDELTRRIDALTRLYNSAQASKDESLLSKVKEELIKLIKM